jgi:hypothetical protein
MKTKRATRDWGAYAATVGKGGGIWDSGCECGIEVQRETYTVSSHFVTADESISTVVVVCKVDEVR